MEDQTLAVTTGSCGQRWRLPPFCYAFKAGCCLKILYNRMDRLLKGVGGALPFALSFMPTCVTLAVMSCSEGLINANRRVDDLKLATGEEKRSVRSIRPKGRPFLIRWSAFMAGLWVMSLGIAVMIRAEMGLAPWDVFHMGLASVTPLTVGMWLQLVGVAVVTLAAVIAWKLPGWGAIINMMLMGWFVDGWLWTGWLETPDSLWGQSIMLLTGLALIGLGNGLYIAPRLGAGPRDALVLVLSEKTGSPLSRVRLLLEVGVLIAGWLLGGPVGAGTLLFSVSIGPMMQLSIQFWDKMMKQWLGRGDAIESIHQRKVRIDDHDGFGGPVRGEAGFAEKRSRAAQPVRALPGTVGGTPEKRRIG